MAPEICHGDRSRCANDMFSLAMTAMHIFVEKYENMDLKKRIKHAITYVTPEEIVGESCASIRKQLKQMLKSLTDVADARWTALQTSQYILSVTVSSNHCFISNEEVAMFEEIFK
jgi:hypothetical protein